MTASALDRMLHPDEARAIVLAHVKSLEPEVVPLEAAGERRLSGDVVADIDLPPFPAATMDGFAVVHDDDTPVREVLGSGFAGDATDIEVRPGQAARIMTGAPVPAGATAVVPVENTAMVDGRLVVRQASVRAGENIRPVGADLRRGELLIPAGTRLGPAEVGILASLGYATVRVGRRPRVAVLSTGNELVAPHEAPGPGQIRDSNRFSLALAARQEGADIVMNAHVRDDETALREAFAHATAIADVLITSGGVSMGERDLVKGLLGEVAHVHIRRIFMKPGKPFTFATRGEKLLFGLPGNPVSCLVGFGTFVAPALRVMQGAPADVHPRVPVTLAHAVEPADRIEYQRAIVWVTPEGTLMARNTGSQISARLMSFVGANALLVVPPGNATYPRNSRLEAILLGAPYDGPR